MVSGYPPFLLDQASYVVDFTGSDDLMHSQSWLLRKKLVTAMVLGYTTLIAAGRLRLLSRNRPRQYSIWSQYRGSLGMSLYVLGFAFGPLVCMHVPFSPSELKQMLIRHTRGTLL